MLRLLEKGGSGESLVTCRPVDQEVAVVEHEELETLVTVLLLEVEGLVTLVAGTGGVDRQSVRHQEAVHMAAGGAAVSSLEDVGALADGHVELAVIFPVKDNLVDAAGVRLVEHLEIRVPTILGIGRRGVHHMGVGDELVGVSNLLGGVNTLSEEPFDLTVDVKRLAGVPRGSGPGGVTRHASASLVIFLEGSLVQGHAGLDQEGEIFRDSLLGAVAEKADGLVKVGDDEAGHLVAGRALAGFHKDIVVVGEDALDDREVTEVTKGVEIGLGSHHVHLADILVDIASGESAVLHFRENLLQEVVADPYP